MHPIEIKSLNSDNIEEFIPLAEKNDVFAKFYSPNCGHCIAMDQDWKNMTLNLKDKPVEKKLYIIEINPEGLQKLQGTKIHNNVLGFPSIHHLKNGKSVNEYHGDRTSQDMEKWLNENILTTFKGKGSVNKSKKVKKIKKVKKSKKVKKVKKSKNSKKVRKSKKSKKSKK
jgi:thiol-disulfide isomerase/thioredoxin